MLYLRSRTRLLGWARRCLRGGALLDMRCRTLGLCRTSLLLLRSNLLGGLLMLLYGSGPIFLGTLLLRRGSVALLLDWCSTTLLHRRGIGVLGFDSTLLYGALLLLTNSGRSCGDRVSRDDWTSSYDLSGSTMIG